MINPKQYGKSAKKSGINAPTLDEKFSIYLAKLEADKKLEYLTQWWEGWYEALHESISLQATYLSPKHAV